MNTFKIAAVAFGLMGTTAFAGGHATGDAAAGEDVFKKCKACHSVIDAEGEAIVKGGRNGPNLYGVYQRVAGAEEEFADKYKDDIIAAGEAGLMWDEETFVAYVEDPRAFLREYLDDSKARSGMSFKLRGEEERADVWAYLVSIGPEIEEKEEEEKSE